MKVLFASLLFIASHKQLFLAHTGIILVTKMAAQVSNGGMVVNQGFVFPKVSSLSLVPTPIPAGLQVVCTCDSMLHFWDGLEWHINLDSARTAQIGYLTGSSAASTYQPIGTYATASNSMAFINKTGNVSMWANDAGYLNSIAAQSFSSLTGKPTTLNGYGITDAYPLSGNPSAFLITADISGKRNISDSVGNNGTTALWRLNKARDSVAALIPSLTGYVQATRIISTTSPLTGGGDLSANRTFAINNGAADNTTKGAVAVDSNYFNDNGSGIVSWAVTTGTGSVSANAVTINQPRGKITYTSPSISAGTAIGVTLTNSFITTTSIINIGLNGNGSNLTGVNCYIKSQTAGSCVINVQNLSLLSLFNSAFVMDFFIVN